MAGPTDSPEMMDPRAEAARAILARCISRRADSATMVAALHEAGLLAGVATAEHWHWLYRPKPGAPDYRAGRNGKVAAPVEAALIPSGADLAAWCDANPWAAGLPGYIAPGGGA